MRGIYKKAHVRVPATSANLGPGFDCVGCALKLYNTVTLEINKPKQKQELCIDIKGFGAETLSREKKNLVYRVIKEYFKRKHFSYKTITISLVNNIPLARGLGSSAAAVIGALVAAQNICGNTTGKKDDAEIIDLAVLFEGHADNVVPAYFGGLCITRKDEEQVIWWKDTVADDLCAVVCIPDFEVRTPHARELMPAKYTRKTAIFTASGAAFFVSAVTAKPSPHRDQIIQNAMKDKFHQPYRKQLVSGMQDVFVSAVNAGAVGVALSGSGPSIIALVKKQPFQKQVGVAMMKAFARKNIKSSCAVLVFDKKGTFLL